MSVPPPAQLLLEFTALGRGRADARTAESTHRGEQRPEDRGVGLRWFRASEEYFEANEPSGTAEIELPRPFEDTAFRDVGGWRREPRRHDAAIDLGRRMWSTLPADLREEIRSGTADVARRVAVISTSSGMDDVPWEWLAADDGEPIASTASVRFIRLVPSHYTAPPVSIALPLRVLLVVPNPKDERLLQPRVEMDVVSHALRGDPRFEVQEVDEPTLRALVDRLQWLPHVVHYVGHSGLDGGTGNLILHDRDGHTHWLTPSELARVLPTSVRCIHLSTPVTAQNYQTGGLAKFAHCPAEVSLPTAITNQYAVRTDEAARFWSTLYPALIDLDGDLVEATHRARIACRSADAESASWASFSLVVRDGIGRPLRFARPNEVVAPELVAEEIEAQWSARLANALATRMHTLDVEAKKSWVAEVADEASRLSELTQRIDEAIRTKVGGDPLAHAREQDDGT